MFLLLAINEDVSISNESVLLGKRKSTDGDGYNDDSNNNLSPIKRSREEEEENLVNPYDCEPPSAPRPPSRPPSPYDDEPIDEPVFELPSAVSISDSDYIILYIYKVTV